jgi:hypothetical protein
VLAKFLPGGPLVVPIESGSPARRRLQGEAGDP